MQVHVNNQAFATYPILRRMLVCTEKVYRLLVALQPEDASALHVGADEAATLVELRVVRDKALLSQEDEMAPEPPAVAGAKRPADAEAADAPRSTRARLE